MKSKTKLTTLPAILVALGVLFLAACSGGPQSPSDVADGFYGALKAKDAEKAVTYFPPSTLEQPGAKEKILGLLKQAMTDAPEIQSYEIVDENIDGDSATVEVKYTNEDGSEESETVKLIKEDENWYVTM